MTKKDDAPKSSTATKRKSPARKKAKRGGAQKANGGLTGKQVLALWELVIAGDGTTATQRSVKLDPGERTGLESTPLVTVKSGTRKKDPKFGSKLHLTEEGWNWANHQGLDVSFSPSSIPASLLETLLEKVGAYMKVHDLALDDLLRPRRADAEPGEAASPAGEEQNGAAPNPPASAPLEERIRSAYLHVTGGKLNQYVKLAQLRAELRDAPVDAVDAELRGMQQRGGAVLYPIDDPQRLRPEDEAAALRVSGERRDLLCIEG